MMDAVPPSADPATSTTTLVTGYPRLLARELALRSAKRSPTLVLVRAQDEARAREELGGVPQLRTIAGDPTAIDLGLSGPDYDHVLGSVTHLHHVPPRAGKSRSRDDVIASTRELLELAAASRALVCGVHHSSVQVFGDREGWIQEETKADARHVRGVKDEVLALSENLVDRELSRLPLAIARSGFVAGHSETGETERPNGIYLLALLCLSTPSELRLPFPGRGEWQLNLVPVDWVAETAVRLVHADGVAHQRFHLVDPSPFSARRVFELVAAAASALRETSSGFMPAGFGRALLRAPGLEPLMRSPRAFFEAWMRDVRFSSLRTNAALGPNAPVCPSFDSYVAAIVSQVAETTRSGLGVRPREREEPLEDEDPLL